MVGLSSEFGIWNAWFFFGEIGREKPGNPAGKHVTQTRQVGHEAYRCRNSGSPESLHQVAIPLCCCHSFLGSEKLLVPFNRWYISLIYCQLRDYIIPTHPLWEPETTVELSAKVEFGCVLRLFSRRFYCSSFLLLNFPKVCNTEITDKCFEAIMRQGSFPWNRGKLCMSLWCRKRFWCFYVSSFSNSRFWGCL